MQTGSGIAAGIVVPLQGAFDLLLVTVVLRGGAHLKGSLAGAAIVVQQLVDTALASLFGGTISICRRS